jgi:gas vesicle protein
MAQNNSDKLVWFLAGSALGAAIALLYAPQAGEDTRRYLSKQARKGRRVLEDVSEDLTDRGREMYEKGRRLADDAYDKGRRIADDAAELFERGKRIVEG